MKCEFVTPPVSNLSTKLMLLDELRKVVGSPSWFKLDKGMNFLVWKLQNLACKYMVIDGKVKRLRQNIQSLLVPRRNHDINPRLYLNSVIDSIPYFEKASEDELRVMLPHKWKEFHPEAIMKTPVRQLAK